MKSKSTYPIFIISIFHLLLLTQVWVNTFPHVYQLVNTDSEPIELCNSEDSESEEENEKEKDDKISNENKSSTIWGIQFSFEQSLADKLLSFHIVEIITPPPKNITHI